MKPLALGSCLVCVLVLVWVAYRVTERKKPAAKTQAAASPSLIASPQMLPQRASGSEVILRAGTKVSVTLAEPIDSDNDPFGKKYAASVNDIDGQSIGPSSRATVTMLNNNTGWLTQLTGLTLNGRNFQVLSSAGSVISGEPAGNAGPTGGILGQMGLAPAAAPPSNPAARLPPATQLRFVLLVSPTIARVAASRRYRPATSMGTEFSSTSADSIAASQQEPEFAYLCRATDAPERALPISYYLADVFKTSDDPSLVERSWYQFLVTTYPYKFANNRHANARCTRLTDPVEEIEPPENAETVRTRWRYTLGPTPSPTSPPAVSFPSRRTE